MADLDDQDTIAQFVLRARRIQAHSLVRDWDALVHHAQGSLTGHLDISGTTSLTRKLPEDEEAFESLAARVRPLTVKSEPIYYVTVLDAVERLLHGSAATTDAHRDRLQRLRGAWEASELQGTAIQGYAVQSIRVDGTDATPLVADTQLAAGWLYADLVHADPKGPKQEALRFPLRERYAAAVRVFSRIAALAASTLSFVETLRKAGLISIDERAWNQDVIVGASELTETARILVAPPETSVPDLRDSALGLTDDWRPFTVTDLLRQDPANHVSVRLARGDASTVAEYEAAVAHRRVEGSTAHWHVLVAGSVMVHFEFDVEGELLTRPSVAQWEAFNSTNQLILASTQLQLQLHEAETMVFEVGGEAFVTLEPSQLDEHSLYQVRAHTETVSDIVAIETATGEDLIPCIGAYDDAARVHLRQTRLILEGNLVASTRGPLIITAVTGKPPQVIAVHPGQLEVGGTLVPIPGLLLRHPTMVSRDLGADTTTGPEARRFEVSPPDDERFLAWCPHLREVTGDQDLVDATPWGLTGIDEETFPR